MKHLKIGFYLLFLLPLFASSCDKNELLEHTIVKGIVKDAGTGKAIPEATVYLIEKEWSITWTGSFSYIVDSVVTGADAAYEFQFKENQDYSYSYYVSANKADYWRLSPASIPLSYQENNMDISIFPHAWIKFHIKNVNPFDNRDNIHYTGSWGGGSPEDNFGPNIDLYDIKMVEGNQDIYLHWIVVKDNTMTRYSDTLYCAGHDTTFYEILY